MSSEVVSTPTHQQQSEPAVLTQSHNKGEADTRKDDDARSHGDSTATTPTEYTGTKVNLADAMEGEVLNSDNSTEEETDKQDGARYYGDIKRCDSNDDLEYRGLSEVRACPVGEHTQQTQLDVHEEDKKKKAKKDNGWKLEEHELASRGILYHGVVTEPLGRDGKCWDKAFTKKKKDGVYTPHFRKVNAKRVLILPTEIPREGECFIKPTDENYGDWKRCKETNGIFRDLVAYPIVPTENYFWVNDGRKNGKNSGFRALKKEDTQMRTNYHTPEVCDPGSANCVCCGLLALSAKGRFEEGNNEELKYKKVHELTKALLPLRKIFEDTLLEGKKTLQSKEVFCYFFRYFNSTLEQGVNQFKFVLKGTDARATAQAHSYGCPIGHVPLCDAGLSYLLLPHDRASFQKHFYRNCLMQPRAKTVKKNKEGEVAPKKVRGKNTSPPGVSSQKANSEETVEESGHKTTAEGSSFLALYLTKVGRNAMHLNTFYNFVVEMIYEEHGGMIVGHNPPLPAVGAIFRKWNASEECKSTRYKYGQTFYENLLTPVRAIHGLESNAKNVTEEEKQKASSVRLAIAYHKFRYIVNCRNSEKMMLLKGKFAYRYGGRDVRHDCDVQVLPTEVPTKVHQLLTGALEKEIGIIPKREGGKLNGWDLQRYHGGMRTFFQVWAEDDEDAKTTYSEIGNPTWQLSELFGTEHITEEEYELVLRPWMEGLIQYAGSMLGIKKEDMKAHAYCVEGCCVRWSRFEADIKERTLPHLEHSRYTQNVLRRWDRFVGMVSCTVPLSPEGQFQRYYSDVHDYEGTLVKIMPRTVVMHPISMMQEMGRITHIEGNPHMVFKIGFMKLAAMEACEMFEMKLETFDREYLHVRYTQQEMEDREEEENSKKRYRDGSHKQNTKEWEKKMRFITPHKNMRNIKVDPIQKDLIHLEGQGSKKLDEYFAI